jgi:hypothetical protein
MERRAVLDALACPLQCPHQSPGGSTVVSLFAFVVTAYGMNPYLVATFNSGLACETAKSAVISAALEQNMAGTSTYALAPKNLKCISTPGLVAGGSRPPEASTPYKAAPPAPAKRPLKK